MKTSRRVAPAMTTKLLPVAPKVGPLSRALHAVGTFTSRASVASGVAVTVVVIMVLLAVAGFPEDWQFRFGTASGAITLIMVFVIQHTQSRQQLVTQLKLDELIHSSPHADDRAVHLEAAADEELSEVENERRRHHTAMRREA